VANAEALVIRRIRGRARNMLTLPNGERVAAVQRVSPVTPI
jgi:hypothetical protein